MEKEQVNFEELQKMAENLAHELAKKSLSYADARWVLRTALFEIEKFSFSTHKCSD